jgi:hypothetical protein
MLICVEAAQDTAPSINVSPSSGLAGITVTVSGSGFTGGFNAAIRWDGVEKVTFTMSPNGSFSKQLKIPGNASPGPHTISVCNYCGGGEFEENASTGFKVKPPPTTPPPPPTDTPRRPTKTSPPPKPTYTSTSPPILITPPPPDILPPPSLLESALFDVGPDYGITLIEFFPFLIEGLPYRENMIGARSEGSMQVARPSVSPYSGEFAAKSIVGENGSALQPIRLNFTLSLRGIGMYVGIEEGPSKGKDVTATLIVYGFRNGGSELIELGSDSIVFPHQPADIIYPLFFVADEGDIIVQTIVEYTDSDGKSVIEARWMDDLILVFYEEVELPEDLPPGVYILSPEDGSKITSTEDPSPIIESKGDQIPEVVELVLPGEVLVDQTVLYIPDCTPNQATFSALISDAAFVPVYISVLVRPTGDTTAIGIEIERDEKGVFTGILQLNKDSPIGIWEYTVVSLDGFGLSYQSQGGTISVNSCTEEIPASLIGDQHILQIPRLAVGLFVLAAGTLVSIVSIAILAVRNRPRKVVNPQSTSGGTPSESKESARQESPPDLM